jgi:RNA polymerase sigma factor (sigma-70 family)
MATRWRATDKRLAALASTGDESAFEAIFDRHHRGVLALCRHLLGSPEEAEDAVQHTFAAAFRQLVEREPPEHLRAWLYATARHRCLDVLRARRELPSEVTVSVAAGLSDEVERRSDLRDLVDDIGRLPEAQRAALVMSEIGDLGHAEVAEVLGCSREKVRALVYQARSTLSGWRDARALPCGEVREELAVARGAALRRGHLRRHLKLCGECAAFRHDIERRREQLGLALPALASVGLKERVLDAAWAAAAPGGGAAAAGGGLALGAAAVKVGAAAVLVGLGVAGYAGFRGNEGESTQIRTLASDRSTGAAGVSSRSPRADPMSAPKRLREQTADLAAAGRLAPGALGALTAAGVQLPAPRLEDAPDPQELPAPHGVPAPRAVPAPQVPAPPQAPAPPEVEPPAPVPDAEVELEVNPPAPIP